MDNCKMMIPWWLRAMRPREQEREKDSKFMALCGNPSPEHQFEGHNRQCKTLREAGGSN